MRNTVQYVHEYKRVNRKSIAGSSGRLIIECQQEEVAKRSAKSAAHHVGRSRQKLQFQHDLRPLRTLSDTR